MAFAEEQTLALILRYPGLDGKTLEQKLGISSQESLSLLHGLQQKGEIIVVKEQGNNHYLPMAAVLDASIYCALRKPNSWKLIQFVKSSKDASVKEAAKALSISRTAASYQLKGLVRNEILEIYSKGPLRQFRVKNSHSLEAVLAKFEPIDAEDLGQYGH